MPPNGPSTAKQVAALPLRFDAQGGTEVLILTSRDTGRWIIPKGWPMPGKCDHDAAAIEAHEEAGVSGTVDPMPVGAFVYFKRKARHFDLVEVTVYRLVVERYHADWKERGERRLEWTSPTAAAAKVQEPGLSSLLLALASA